MQVNPEDGPPEIYVTWSDPRMTDFENTVMLQFWVIKELSALSTVALTIK